MSIHSLVPSGDGVRPILAGAMVKRPIRLALFLSLACLVQSALVPIQSAQADFRSIVSDLWPPEPAHPAVVRIEVAERGAVSHGSGTLFDVVDQYGLVLTNWHVVRDAAGQVVVVFPTGFRSAARVLKVDADWDLAVLAIWRPPIDPMPLADTPPRPGDVLTIAGYGRGQYRAATGHCTQYVAPGMDLPYEMVEVSVSARQGDSGGPIINDRGELAGVLFGSSGNATSGSHVGRLRSFLASIRPKESSTEQTLTPKEPQRIATITRKSVSQSDATQSAATPPDATQTDATPPPSSSAPDPSPRPRPRLSQRLDPEAAGPSATATLGTGQLQAITWGQLAGDSTWEKAKSLLAVIGLIAVISQLSRPSGRSRR